MLVLLIAVLAAAIGASAEDETLWAEIGKAEAAGWNVPVDVPEGAIRELATFGGDTRIHQVTNVTGEVWCEALFEGEGSCYFEFRGAGHEGVVCGAYGGKPVEGKSSTRHCRALYPELKAVYGSLKPKDGQKAVPSKCTLFSRSIGVVLRSPEDGATLADNTPDFAWYSDDDLGVTVEWSRDATFPEKNTERRFVADPTRFVTVERPLKPGVWYWRVTTASGFVSPVRSFRQTAAVSADCTPPDLVAVPRYQPLATAPYGFRVGADTVRVTARLGDEQLDARFKGGRAGVKPPKGGWPVGVSRIELTASDKAGNVASVVTWISHAPDLPQVVWGGGGEPVRIGGKPFGLRLFYCCVNAKSFDSVRELGFTAVQDYGRDHRPKPTDVKAMDELGARGMMTMIGINGGDINRVDTDRLVKKIGMYLARKELLAWYLFDEPDLHDVSPVRLRRTARLVRALDPLRPRLLTTYYPTVGADKYTDCCDVFLTQAYCATAEQAGQKWNVARQAFAKYQPAVKHTLIVNPNRANDAKELTDQMRLGLKEGCGIMLWAWHNVRDAEQLKKTKTAAAAVFNLPSH